MSKNTDKRSQVDMLNGPLAGKIILFALPLAASSVLQQLFNAADLAVVGRFSSSKAMAAVGSNSSVISLMVSLFLGLSVGANVLIASMIGEGRQNKINEAIHTVIAVAIAAGLLLLMIGMVLAKPILQMMGAPEEVMNLAVLYLRIYFVGMPFMMIYNFGSAVLRSKGDSRRPLYFLIVAGILNVILNLIFVAGFHLHVIGVASATVISNGVSACLTLRFLINDEEPFKLKLKKLRIKPDQLKYILRVGIPAGLQGTIFSLSNVVIQSAINSFGADAIAGSTAAQNFEFITFCVTNAFVQAAITFTSQNYAAGKKARCKRIFVLSLLIGFSCAELVNLSLILSRHTLIQLFTTDEAVISYAMIRIMTVAIANALIANYEITGGCLRGMGYSILPTLITVFGSCVLRLIWIFTFFAINRSFQNLMLVYPVSWVITGSSMLIAYFIISRKVLR